MNEKQRKDILDTKTTLEFDKYVMQHSIYIDEWTQDVHDHLQQMREERLKEFDINKPIHVLKERKIEVDEK